MSKRSRSAAAGAKKNRQEWPLVVYIWILGLGFGGYLVVGEFILGNRPHPIHWVAGLVGGLLGIPIGWLWYRWRGDVL